MVGFGRYTYRYDSGHSGETLVVEFSPRKGDLSFYGLTTGAEAMLAQLGPHRTGKGCLYIKRLAAVDETVLCALIRSGVTEISTHWPVVKV